MSLRVQELSRGYIRSVFSPRSAQISTELSDLLSCQTLTFQLALALCVWTKTFLLKVTCLRDGSARSWLFLVRCS